MAWFSLRSFVFKLGLLSVLLAVLFQATPSTPFSETRNRGSAFDATTVEVAILAQRDGVEQLVPILKPAPVPDLVAVPQSRAIDFVVDRPFDPRKTGPPLKSIWRLAPPMRGPPLLT